MSELVDKLDELKYRWGAVRVVKWDGFGNDFSEAYWDCDLEDKTVVVID